MKVSPAPAGMIPVTRTNTNVEMREPRTRGDDPFYGDEEPGRVK